MKHKDIKRKIIDDLVNNIQNIEKNNFNLMINYSFCDDKFFDMLFNQEISFYKNFSLLSYDDFLKIILNMQDKGLEKYNNNFLDFIPIEYQYKILEEKSIKDNTLIFLLNKFSNGVISYFFEKDNRSLYLYDRFNIPNLVKKGIRFNKDLVSKKDFFELLKGDSFIGFRSNINNLEKYNDLEVIEKRVSEYYKELINSYDTYSELFLQYVNLINEPSLLKNIQPSYFFDNNIINVIKTKYLSIKDDKYSFLNKDEFIMFLKDETNKKLSEIIIDALFGDNIYNVFINLKEMIRYHNLLDNDSKIFDDEKIKFYELILNFDKISSSDKIELYNKLKNAKCNLMFYEDLRKVKDLCYNRIKKDIVNINDFSDLIDSDKSSKYGVSIFDFRNKNYFMLVRTQGKFNETNRYRRGCYSLISENNNVLFGSYDNLLITYGYNSFDNDMVLHMFESDSNSSNIRDTGSNYVNRIMTTSELVKFGKSYNEIQIVNRKSENGKYLYDNKKPDYIVVYDNITNKHILEAKRLAIPIVVISKKKEQQKAEYDIYPDKYFYESNLSLEEIKKNKR